MKKWIFNILIMVIMAVILAIIFDILGVRFYLIIWAVENDLPMWFIDFLMGGFLLY